MDITSDSSDNSYMFKMSGERKWLLAEDRSEDGKTTVSNWEAKKSITLYWKEKWANPGFMDLLRDKFFYRAVFAEFVATTIFLYYVTAVLVSIREATVVQISLCIGLSIAILVHIFGPISGAHINPAVTLGILVTGKINVLRALFYFIAQMLGSIAGSAITYSVAPPGARGQMGSLNLNESVMNRSGVVVELILTVLLVFTVLASTDENRGHNGFPPALAIGFSITVGHLAAIQFSGAGMNPARVFGPAVVLGSFPDDHYVYWVGPMIGAPLAALTYKWIFSFPEKKPVRKVGYVSVNGDNAEVGI